MDNITLNNDLGLNLYVILTTYHMIITSDVQKEVRNEFLVGV